VLDDSRAVFARYQGQLAGIYDPKSKRFSALLGNQEHERAAKRSQPLNKDYKLAAEQA
jgi:hypothetical protein